MTFEVKVNLPSNISVTALQDIPVPDLLKPDANEKLNDNDNLQESYSSDEENQFKTHKSDRKTFSKELKLQEGNLSSDKEKTVLQKPIKKIGEPKVRGFLPGFCQDCDKDVKQLGYHRKQFHGTVSICELCSKQFNSLQLLEYQASCRVH